MTLWRFKERKSGRDRDLCTPLANVKERHSCGDSHKKVLPRRHRKMNSVSNTSTSNWKSCSRTFTAQQQNSSRATAGPLQSSRRNENLEFLFVKNVQILQYISKNDTSDVQKCPKSSIQSQKMTLPTPKKSKFPNTLSKNNVHN